jgi:hypothetical protein
MCHKLPVAKESLTVLRDRDPLVHGESSSPRRCGMSNIMFHQLTDTEAEEMLTEIWICLERFSLPSPALALAQDGNNGRSKIRVEFANECDAMLGIQRLSRPTVGKMVLPKKLQRATPELQRATPVRSRA